MKTLLAALLAALVLAAPARAVPGSPDAQLRFFAVCTGRLSARMEHDWLVQSPRSDRTEAQRAAMAELLRAASPPSRGPEVMGWRIQAKASFAALLSRASFGRDPEDAAWAEARARALLATCESVLLG
ncbi:hypothetical protein [Histidinibacterium aquaticum]|uniref:Uncharacterized protein n=1 Tax=Histidinibacterium aquaticum TaxID=2613962 RepID=A0A5J5GJJ0_9RHOB|nr:hypothetical protein [Histidinibacterium aquaticum]KAA9007913.1 hypothetical protein F3S47_10345 [Histidinibacterium aquaticum]